jgi:hypothetical protein
MAKLILLYQHAARVFLHCVGKSGERHIVHQAGAL